MNIIGYLLIGVAILLFVLLFDAQDERLTLYLFSAGHLIVGTGAVWVHSNKYKGGVFTIIGGILIFFSILFLAVFIEVVSEGNPERILGGVIIIPTLLYFSYKSIMRGHRKHLGVPTSKATDKSIDSQYGPVYRGIFVFSKCPKCKTRLVEQDFIGDFLTIHFNGIFQKVAWIIIRMMFALIGIIFIREFTDGALEDVLIYVYIAMVCVALILRFRTHLDRIIYKCESCDILYKGINKTLFKYSEFHK